MSSQLSQLRDALLAHLRQHHSDMCRHWFENIEPVDMNGGVLKLLVRETVQLRYLQRCCVEPFTEAARACTGHLMTVRFIGEDELSASMDPLVAGTAGEDGESVLAGGQLDEEMLLSPDYCFENFVIGPGNRLAHAAAMAVAKKPGRAYNPFFIHGGVGLGKTHLLQAICQHSMRDNRELRIHYVSCNSFMTSFFESVQQGKMSSFRHRFRNVDLLVIDDIHELSNRGPTQEEFFHTFNSLYQAGKQIVLSSDAAPNEIPDLEERLTSRFNCGLVAFVDKPCFETRMAIVKAKANLRSLDMPDDIASYIAARIDTNIRELEGAITKIHNVATVTGEPLTLDLAKQAIGDQTASSTQQSAPTIQTIFEAVTGYYDVKLSDLLSKKRQKSIAKPRQIGMWLARKYTRYSLEEIGGYFGGRDHTTVMHAIRTIDSSRELDATLKVDVSRLEHTLNGQSNGS